MEAQLIFFTLIIIYFTTAIKGDIRDFMIENENDLQRFGLSSETDQQHYEDDVDSDWMYDECGYGGAAAEAALGYDPHSDVDEHQGNSLSMDMNSDMSQIDPTLLREILRQLQNDPRFEHLREHLSEENIFVTHNMPEHVADGSEYFIDIDDGSHGNFGDNEIEW